MPTLNTAQQVIKRAGADQLADYFDLEEMVGEPGFALKRRYPQNTNLGQVVDGLGRPSVTCVIQFVVNHPTAAGGVSRVDIHAFFYDHWQIKRFRQPGLDDYDFNDPDCHTPQSLNLLRRSSKPLSLNFTEGFIYDTADDKFYDENGARTAQELIDFAYDYHCRTLSPRFRIKWWCLELMRQAVHQFTWRLQDASMWLLRHGYDMVLTSKVSRNPFYQYRWSDFERTTDKERSNFFGFQSSPRSIFSNLILLGLVCFLVYRFAPHSGFIRAIYANTALTTGALILGFCLVDLIAPLSLEAIVWSLSRIRHITVFLVRKVRA